MPKPSELSFLTDENLAATVVAHLRAQGVDVVTAVERGLRGASDAKVLLSATADGRVVLTQDLDFGYLAVAEGAQSFGIVLVRPGDLLPSEVVTLLDQFRSSTIELAPPFLAVVEQGAIRVRSLSKS